MHMYWYCEHVAHFWKMVTSTLSEMLGRDLPCTPTATLLNIFQYSKSEKRIALSGLTAAKKILAQRWQPPHTLTRSQWLNTFLDLTVADIFFARMHCACETTLATWSEIYTKLSTFF